MCHFNPIGSLRERCSSPHTNQTDTASFVVSVASGEPRFTGSCVCATLDTPPLEVLEGIIRGYELTFRTLPVSPLRAANSKVPAQCATAESGADSRHENRQQQ